MRSTRTGSSLADAQRAAALWQERLSRQPDDFEAAWRLGRAGYWLGGHLPTVGARVAAFETGMDAARKAIAAQAARPEGYFWLAANMGGLAELKGLRAGIKYRAPVRQNLEKVLALDPAFQKGSADRALGRWYFKVPGLFGGSNRKSEEHLRKSLTYHPQSIASRYFLAETLEDMGRKADAIRAAPARSRRWPSTPTGRPRTRSSSRRRARCLPNSRTVRTAPVRPWTPGPRTLDRLDHFHRHRHSDAAAHAQRRQSAREPVPPQRVHQRDDDACARAADGMTERDGAAVDVEFALRNRQVRAGPPAPAARRPR